MLGLSDISADGSSGVVKVTVEDAVVYQSPTLTPGMEVPLTLPIALPYRFGLQASDTSTGNQVFRVRRAGPSSVRPFPVRGRVADPPQEA